MGINLAFLESVNEYILICFKREIFYCFYSLFLFDYYYFQTRFCWSQSLDATTGLCKNFSTIQYTMYNIAVHLHNTPCEKNKVLIIFPIFRPFLFFFFFSIFVEAN